MVDPRLICNCGSIGEVKEFESMETGDKYFWIECRDMDKSWCCESRNCCTPEEAMDAFEAMQEDRAVFNAQDWMNEYV